MTEDANNDPIGNALNLSPIDKSSGDKFVNDLIASAHDDSAKQDFELARANIHSMIMSGQEAMETLSQIASSSQHPRAFEVLAKLMDTMLNANKDLMTLQEKIREIHRKKFYNQLLTSDRLKNRLRPLFTEDEYVGVIDNKYYKFECLICEQK
jgi:predicted nucleic acid-binding protein